MKLVFVVLSYFVCYALVAQPSRSAVSVGTIVHHDSFPSKFIAARNVDVWLPPNYDPTKRYEVLYMHDGQMLFDSTVTWNKQEWGADETVGKLIADKIIPPCIIVGIWNSGKTRHVDYFPQKPFESLTQFQKDTLLKTNRPNGPSVFAAAPRSDNYLKFIVKELKPFIDKKYATYPGPKHTFIAGSSMGGLISMYAICEYPKVFGAAACLSTHWPGIFTTNNNPIPDAFVNYLKQKLPSPNNHKIYFDYGTLTLDALYEPYQQRVDAVMKQKGYTAQNWLTRKFMDDDHSEKAWNSRLRFVLHFLMHRSTSFQ